MTEGPAASQFECQNCHARYVVVRAPAGPETVDFEITCRKCGAPFLGREGTTVLKYFLVDHPQVEALRRRIRQ